MSYLVDTSWIVEHIRGNQDFTERLDAFSGEGLAVSVVSVAELYEGAFRSNNTTRNIRSIRDFLDTVVVLGIDDDICMSFGREMARLSRVGMIMGDLDLLIAATALQHDLTLLTLDSDFERVEGLRTVFS